MFTKRILLFAPRCQGHHSQSIKPNVLCSNTLFQCLDCRVLSLKLGLIRGSSTYLKRNDIFISPTPLRALQRLDVTLTRHRIGYWLLHQSVPCTRLCCACQVKHHFPARQWGLPRRNYDSTLAELWIVWSTAITGLWCLQSSVDLLLPQTSIS